MIRTEHIAISRPDGFVEVMQVVETAPVTSFSFGEDEDKQGWELSDDGTEWHCEVTDEVIKAEIAKSRIEFASWRRVGEGDIPADRTFRNAWSDDGKGIGVNMDRAKDIARAQVRVDRPKLLEALDNALRPFDVKVALGTLTDKDKATITALEAKRQALRDAPQHPAIDAAKTPDDLKAAIVEALDEKVQ